MARVLLRRVRMVVVPVVAVTVAFGIRYSLDPLIVDDDAPFILLLAAVMASAYLEGLYSGLFATLLGLGASTVFMWPEGKVLSEQSATKFELASFLIEAVVIAFLCHALHRARERAETSADEARQLQREVSDAADREQRRIGQDLHDDLGQFLTGVALSGELLARKMDREHSPHLSQCRNLVSMMNDAVNRTRQLARGMSPMAVDPDSLPMLISELQERSAEVSGKSVTFGMTGTPLDLPRETVLHLYRVAQEAVSNALKHSGGDLIEIELEWRTDRLRLCVGDNGRGGLRPGHGGGMGLRVMEFRSKAIGAELEIRDRETGGTLVAVELKVEEADGVGKPLPRPEKVAAHSGELLGANK